MALNRGEWSELYAILSILDDEYLNICDEKLNVVQKDLFQCVSIQANIANTAIYYKIQDNNIDVIIDKNVVHTIPRQFIKECKENLIEKIRNTINRMGAFDINEMNPILDLLTPLGHNQIKSGSSFKEDIVLTVKNLKFGGDLLKLQYNIKSSLGSPATILNASRNTNFIYEINNFDDSKIDEINSICSRSKLLDRLGKIEEDGGKIEFLKVENDTFNHNLTLIDPQMPNYLGKVLLNSYRNNLKDLQLLFAESQMFRSTEEARSKLISLLNAVSFGMVPGTLWSGAEMVNGGLIIVKRDGTIVVLDRIYNREKVEKYLINETKLDSPSSSRYHMLELYTNDIGVYFTLNLQIRYKH